MNSVLKFLLLVIGLSTASLYAAEQQQVVGAPS